MLLALSSACTGGAGSSSSGSSGSGASAGSSPAGVGGAGVGGGGTAGSQGGGPPSCTGNQEITTDDQMAAFEALGCTRVTGDLTIFGVSNADFAGLSSLTTVEGHLTIEGNPQLGSLAGLEGLTTVGSFLVLERNLALTTLTGLQNTHVGSLAIHSHPRLTTLGPLLSWPSNAVGGEITITFNMALPECEVVQFDEQQDADCTACGLNDDDATCP